MTRTLLAATAAALLATVAQAQARPGHKRIDADANHDGKVTLSEFQAAQTQRQDRIFARLDTNKDGKITSAEVDAAPSRKPGSGATGDHAGLMRLDANKDGALSRAELGAITERRFKMADANSDGWLSESELLTMHQRTRGGSGAQ